MVEIERDLEKQLLWIKHGTAEVIPKSELVEKLKNSIKHNKPLKVKLGLDPTAPDIHLGHTVVLQKLRQFQQLGHKVIIVLGDYTGRIGDPTGKSSTRKPMSEEELLRNAHTYKQQICKILDENKTEFVFNSSWLAKLTFEEVINLTAKCTVARMLERDDFSKRFKENSPISIHEFLYPLMQGYDSVALEADIEMGGTDQKFNLLMGRHLQKEYGQQPQIAIMMPILEGLDGKQKMSKSLGNYIGIDEPPNEMYGKLMSIPDELMIKYFELVSDFPPEEIAEIKRGLEEGKLHPRDVKMQLAKNVTAIYHGEEQAEKAEEHFKRVFQQQELPDEIPIFRVTPEVMEDDKVVLPKLLVAAGLVSSTSEARRMVKQGAVKIAGDVIRDANLRFIPVNESIVRVGKRRFVKLMV